MADYTPTKTRMTIEEYMALPESNQHMELINGELIVSPAPKDGHQKASTKHIGFFVLNIKEGELRTAPSDLHIDGIVVVQPDIFWISPSNDRCTLHEDGYWHGVPDLIVEILSPSTASRDRGFKYQLYERCGVREYWLVDYESLFIEVYTLQSGKFERLGLFTPGEAFESPILNGLKIEVGHLLE